MNGMAVNSWPYVIAAYAVTWAVILGYALRLLQMSRDRKGSRSSADTPS